MTKSLITYELEGTTALIGLNRPEKCNALNDDLATQFHDAVQRAIAEARVGIVFGHGKHFSGGLDLASLANRLQQGNPGRREWKRRLNAASDAIARGDLPFICVLHGAVVGWGLEIAACTHIRVADETAYFSLPEAQRGIFVGGGGSVRISRLMSVARMTDMMLTGRTLTAEEGERYNLVQYLVEPGTALAKAKELAGKIALNSSWSNYAIVNGLPRISDLSQDDGLFVEDLISATRPDPETLDSLHSFKRSKVTPAPADKRKPAKRRKAD